MCTFHILLHEVLPVVSGEVHQVPQQERLHHGENNILLSPLFIVIIIIIMIFIGTHLNSYKVLKTYFPKTS